MKIKKYCLAFMAYGAISCDLLF